MRDAVENSTSVISVEDVSIGTRSSAMSKIIFALVCCVPVFAAVLFGGVDNVTWAMISLFWAVMVLAWTIDAWTSGGILLSRSALLLPLAGFILIGLVQLLPLGGTVIGSNTRSATELSLDPYSTRFFLVKLVVYITYFAACLTFVNTENRLKKLVWGVIIFGSAMAFYGILQRIGNADAIYGLRDTSGAIPFASFVNQHHFATFMQMTAGMALGLLFGKGLSKERVALLVSAIIVMGVATVSTSSRGGLIGFFGVVAFVVLLSYLTGRWSGREGPSAAMQRTLAIAAAGIALVVIIFGVALLIGGNDSLLRGIGVSNANTDLSSGRLHFWPIALKIFIAHPILGAGFESFGVAFTRYDTWSGQFRVEQAHNEYLQTLADSGILGFLCLLAFIVLLFKKAMSIIAGSSGFRRDAAAGALAGCLGVLIHSFFDFPLRTPSNAFFFLILCTAATVSISSSERHHRRLRRSTEP